MSTTSERLAEAFKKKQGYSEGTVPEAMPLLSACDIILTKSDGMHLFIICIVDAENRESAQFGMGRDEAKEILAVCCERYSGTMNGAKLPVALVVIEARHSIRSADTERLRGYSNRFFDSNVIHAFLVDSTKRELVTATRFSFVAGWGWRRFLQREISLHR